MLLLERQQDRYLDVEQILRRWGNPLLGCPYGIQDVGVSHGLQQLLLASAFTKIRTYQSCNEPNPQLRYRSWQNYHQFNSYVPELLTSHPARHLLNFE